MMTTLGRVLLRQSLPDKYKQYADRLWDKGTVESESPKNSGLKARQKKSAASITLWLAVIFLLPDNTSAIRL